MKMKKGWWILFRWLSLCWSFCCSFLCCCFTFFSSFCRTFCRLFCFSSFRSCSSFLSSLSNLSDLWLLRHLLNLSGGNLLNNLLFSVSHLVIVCRDCPARERDRGQLSH